MRIARERPRRLKRELSGIRGLLPKYRSGEITAARFFEGTRRDFDRLASNLMVGWDLPAAVSVEDVAQELRLNVLRAIDRWDPARCDLAQYAVFKACGEVKGWLNKQRSAARAKGGQGQSRYPLLLIDGAEREERAALLDRIGATEATQEDELDREERASIARRVAEQLGCSVDGLHALLVAAPGNDVEARWVADMRGVIARRIEGPVCATAAE